MAAEWFDAQKELVFPQAVLDLPPGTELSLWDLDSTLCDTWHRQPMVADVKEGRATWDDYSMACHADTPIAGSVALMRHLLALGQDANRRQAHLGVSGRSNDAYNMTMNWCRVHNVPLHDAILRPPGSTVANGIFKVAVVRALQARGYLIPLFFEDWGPVADYIAQETGVPVVGINPFYPEPDPAATQGGVTAAVPNKDNISGSL